MGGAGGRRTARVEQQLVAERDRAAEHIAAAQMRAEELDAERRRAGELEAQRQRIEDAIGEERGRLTHERDEVRRTLETTRHDLQGLQAELDRVGQMLEAATHERDGALRARQDAAEREQLLTSELIRERQSREEDVRKREAHDASLAEARLAERQSQLAVVERVLTAVRAMDASRSLSDVLTSLTSSAASEAPRVALFVLNGDDLRGWKSAGFAGEPSSLRASVKDPGVLGEALRRREPVATSEGEGPAAPAFAELPPGRAAMAVPLLVGNQPVAVLYADDAADGTPAAPASWPEAIQILGRHASVTLAHLTAARAADAMRRSMRAGRLRSAWRPENAERCRGRQQRAALRAAAGVGNQVVQRGGGAGWPSEARSAGAAEAGNRSRAQAVLPEDFAGYRFTRRAVPSGTGADAGRRRPIAPGQPRVKFFAARTLAVLAVSAIVVFCTSDRRARAQSALGPTQHPALPASESDLWLVPAAADRTARANPTAQTLAAAVNLYDSGEYSTAQATLNRLPPSPALLDYVDYYKGLVQLRLKQYPEARRTLEALAGRKPVGAISLNTALALGETAEASGRLDDAIEIYRRIADDRHLVSDDVLSRLGAVAMSAGDRKTAAAAYLRVYYEFALSDLATAAASHLATLQDQIVKTGYQQDLGRAAMLFGARRYAEARTAFQEIQRQASGDDRELADLRVAECDFHLKRYAAARDGVRPYLERASRKAEARFFNLSALRELGQHDEYVAQTRALVAISRATPGPKRR